MNGEKYNDKETNIIIVRYFIEIAGRTLQGGYCRYCREDITGGILQ